ELHILDNGPRSSALLIAPGEQHGKAALRFLPVVFHDAALYPHAATILELEDILDRPPRPFEPRLVLFPSQGLGHAIAADFNVGGDKILDDGIASSEHDVFTTPLQIIVANFEWTSAAPAEDGLGILSHPLEVGDIRIHDRQMPAV